MAVYRIRDALRFLACSLLLCAAIVPGPGTSFAQMADSSGERTSNAGLRCGTLGFSGHVRKNNDHTRNRPPKIQGAIFGDLESCFGWERLASAPSFRNHGCGMAVFVFHPRDIPPRLSSDTPRGML
jgi:hypothetical protein